MTKKFRMNYLRAIHQRYQKAPKTRILDEFCGVCGYHHIYALAKLRLGPQPSHRNPTRPRTPPKTYDSQVLLLVTAIWEAAQLSLVRRLKAILSFWIKNTFA